MISSNNERPGDCERAAANPKAKIKDVKMSIPFPFIGSQAAVASIIMRPTKKKESSNDAVVEGALDARAQSKDAVVINKTAIAVGCLL
jgi:hypothetical protein